MIGFVLLVWTSRILHHDMMNDIHDFLVNLHLAQLESFLDLEEFSVKLLLVNISRYVSSFGAKERIEGIQ